MAVERIMFGVGLAQIITSLCSIALCTRHYSDTRDMETSIAHIAVMFAVRCLPSLSLLVCGILGVIISCVKNATARIVHTTMTTQTTVGIAMNIWFFAYQSQMSHVMYDKGSAGKCLIAAIFCLITCLCYLTYLCIQLCRRRSARFSTIDEKSHITDAESAVSSESMTTTVSMVSAPSSAAAK